MKLQVDITKKEDDLFSLVKTKQINVEKKKKKKREISKLLVEESEIHGYITALAENKSKISFILYFGLLMMIIIFFCDLIKKIHVLKYILRLS
jgi:hypothetical protein